MDVYTYVVSMQLLVFVAVCVFASSCVFKVQLSGIERQLVDMYKRIHSQLNTTYLKDLNTCHSYT